MDVKVLNMKLRHYIHHRILLQLAIIAMAAFVLAGFIVYDALTVDLVFWPIVIAAIVGLLVGYAVGRMFLLTWHQDTNKVIMRMDRLSLLLIALYVAFRIVSSRFLGDYFDGMELTVLSFAALGGILIGRFLSMWRSIRRILREQGILK